MRSHIYSVIFLLFVLSFSSLSVAQTRSGKLGVGIGFDGTSFLGDESAKSDIGYGGSLSLFYSVAPGFGLRSNAGVGQLSYNGVASNYLHSDFCLSADFLPNGSVNPFLFAGGGFAMAPITDLDVHYIGGVGMDFFFDEFWSMTVKGEYVQTGSRYYTGSRTPSENSFMRAGLEIRYYFFDQSFITKMLEALKGRYKKN